MTFLWRAAGSPVPFTTKSPYTDVKSNNYFYQPVLWAVEHAIASGTSTTTFSPNDTVTRAAAAVFVYRCCRPTNYPESTIIGQPFTDVSSNAYYANAVNWLSTKVTNLGTEFKPNSVCTNEDFILFLYGVCNGSADANDKASAWSWAENNGLLFTIVHTWDEGAITTEPTCAEMGVKTYTCFECGEIKTEVISALGHSLSKIEAKAPTCTEDGNNEYWTCETCHKVYLDQAGTEETTVAAMTIEKLGHSFTTYIYNNDAKVGVDGTETATCDRDGCDATDTRTAVGTALPLPTFTDVDYSDFYGAAVNWAVANSITSGTAPTRFSPNTSCTREQVVTFLWRASDKPKPESSSCPFADVGKERYSYDAVLWAVENEITAGTAPTRFNPTGTCTRAQVVTFLFRKYA